MASRRPSQGVSTPRSLRTDTDSKFACIFRREGRTEQRCRLMPVKCSDRNTYRVGGLPPGPIASPGQAAIDAVLSPPETKYLYFVSKNDGSHHFSTTLREHNNAVRRYQIEYFRQRRREQRRSPGPS